MIKINLLPHREEKRKQRKNAFFALLAISAVSMAFAPRETEIWFAPCSSTTIRATPVFSPG